MTELVGEARSHVRCTLSCVSSYENCVILGGPGRRMVEVVVITRVLPCRQLVTPAHYWRAGYFILEAGVDFLCCETPALAVQMRNELESECIANDSVIWVNTGLRWYLVQIWSIAMRNVYRVLGILMNSGKFWFLRISLGALIVLMIQTWLKRNGSMDDFSLFVSFFVILYTF